MFLIKTKQIIYLGFKNNIINGINFLILIELWYDYFYLKVFFLE